MLARVVSTVGIWYSFLLTAWFNFVRSTHIRMSPFGFGTTTTEAHYSVGSSTGSMVSRTVKRVIALSNFPRTGKGTLRGEVMQNGFASSFSQMLYSLSACQAHKQLWVAF